MLPPKCAENTAYERGFVTLIADFFFEIHSCCHYFLRFSYAASLSINDWIAIPQ